MPKITFIGAGSTIFAKNLMGDILSFPELANSHIALHDIDPIRLKTSEVVAHRIAEALNVKPTITATTRLAAASFTTPCPTAAHLTTPYAAAHR